MVMSFETVLIRLLESRMLGLLCPLSRAPVVCLQRCALIVTQETVPMYVPMPTLCHPVILLVPSRNRIISVYLS